MFHIIIHFELCLARGKDMVLATSSIKQHRTPQGFSGSPARKVCNFHHFRKDHRFQDIKKGSVSYKNNSNRGDEMREISTPVGRDVNRHVIRNIFPSSSEYHDEKEKFRQLDFAQRSVSEKGNQEKKEEPGIPQNNIEIMKDTAEVDNFTSPTRDVTNLNQDKAHSSSFRLENNLLSNLFQRRNDVPASTSDRIKPIRPGFRNFGNTCYINSALQLLFNLRHFSMAILQASKSEHFPHDGVVTAYANLFSEFLVEKKKRSRDGSIKMESLDALPLKRAVAARVPTFNNNFQQDSQEFLCALIDAIENEFTVALKESKANSTDENSSHLLQRCPVENYLKGRIVHKLTCNKCSTSSSISEPFVALSLDLQENVQDDGIDLDLRLIIESYFASEQLERTCEDCGWKLCHVDHVLDKTPLYLLLHLKRFAFTDGKYASKIDSNVCSPETLTLVNGEEVILNSMIQHIGSGVNSGHYVASVREKCGTWSSCNDENVDTNDSSKDHQNLSYVICYTKESN